LINARLIGLGKNRITDDTVLALDPGDIDKPYAKKRSIWLWCGMGVPKRRRAPATGQWKWSALTWRERN
jgi:hypothetical protein